MTDLTQTQWMWIIGIVVVLALGGLGYYFSTRGRLGMQGAQFQTGFGVGGPSIYQQQNDNPNQFTMPSYGGAMFAN